MTTENQIRRLLLGNDLVKSSPRQRIRKQQSRYFWAITLKTAFSDGDSPRLYNEDPRPAEIELRESLETAVEDD
jgi:hypothetical protein